MKVAACVVSNESGMAHLAGALRVPCVVLTGSLWGSSLHAFWPRTTCIHGPQDGVGSITPEQVRGTVEGVAPQWEALIARLDVACGNGRADRRATMLGFLDAMPASPRIVETGCQRADNDYGAGMSTLIFGLFCRQHGGNLVSVDNDAEHVAFARQRIGGNPVEVVQADSVGWLESYAGPPLDGVYLDSMDTYVPGYEQHCLREAQAAVSKLAPHAVILIDDTMRAGDGWTGKGMLAAPWLLANGWSVLRDGWQVLLKRIA
jgi:SAM-dependent methyltransferase